jgi:hypothetical protein
MPSFLTQIEKNRKYAKWKAAYIHNCLKNGEIPVSGPMAEEGMGDIDNELAGSNAGTGGQFIFILVLGRSLHVEFV